jgi:hypothetical protein
MSGDFLFGHVGETNTFDRSANDEFQIVDNQRAIDSYCQRLLSLLEFLSVQTRRTVAEVDAAVLQEIPGHLRQRMRVQVGGGAHNGGSLIR